MSLLDLRLVEEKGDEQSIQQIHRFPTTIGKKRESTQGSYHVSTLLEIDGLSRVHCTVYFNIQGDFWTVYDGLFTSDHKTPSANGIYCQHRQETPERTDKCTIKAEGDRVYLVSTNDGTQVFLEIYDPRKHPDCERSTKSLDPATVQFRQEIKEQLTTIHQDGLRREEKQDKLSSMLEKVERVGEVIIYADKHKWSLICGAFVLSAIISMAGLFMFAWLYHGRLFDLILPVDRTEKIK